MSQSVQRYKYFCQKNSDRVWNDPWKNEKNPNLIKIRDKTAKQLARLLDSFMPLFEKIVDIPKDTDEYYESRQYYMVYWMSVMKLCIDGYAQVIRYIKKPGFADKYKQDSNFLEPYKSILGGYQSAKNGWQLSLDGKRFDYLIFYDHHACVDSICDEQGRIKFKGQKLEKVIKDYFDKNAPQDYWKVGLKISEIKKQVKLVAWQNQFGNS